jgi:hypothetical protein
MEMRIMFRRRPASLLLALTLATVAIGCARSLDDLPREPVAGTVTMDGQPLPEAVIQFSAAGDAAKNATPGANTEVKDGKFSIPREEGLVPGTYKVSVSHAVLKEVQPKGKGKAQVNTSIPNRNKQLGPEQIPAKYNTQTELKADIKPGSSRDLKFELQSK